MDPSQYSLIAGGPFHSLLGQLRLADRRGLPTVTAALVLAGLAWGLPALLVVAEGLADPTYAGTGFWQDPRTWARWALAVPALLLYEGVSDSLLTRLIASFHDSGPAGGAARAGFAETLARADSRSGSAAAETVMIIAALVTSFTATKARWSVGGATWAEVAVDGMLAASWSGTAVTFVSEPLFAFLFLRWMWRFTVLGLMCRDLARLPLRLHAAHPDGVGGLGFLALYPLVFLGPVFGLSCVVAAGIYWWLEAGVLPLAQVIMAGAIWATFTLVVTFMPLLAFSRPLRQAKIRAHDEYRALADWHHSDFEARWVQAPERTGASPMGAPEISSLTDLNAVVTQALAMKTVPVDRSIVATMAGAAVLPLVPVIPTGIPLVEILRKLLGLLL